MSNRLQFVYCDLPSRMLLWKRRSLGVLVYYWLWQWIAFLSARRLIRNGVSFDVVHHVTFVSLRAPSLMGWLGLPFLLGPVSGGERVPPHLLSGFSARARAIEAVREMANCTIRFDPLMRSSFRRASRIVLTSADTLRIVPNRFRPKCAVHFGVHLSREYLGWTARRRVCREPVLRLLYAGRLLEWKGLGLAVEALRILRDRNVPAELTLIGDGPARSILRKKAASLGLVPHVHWRRWMRHSDLQDEYGSHDVFFYPSLRDSGGMALLEAFAHGLPVVCTDLGGPGIIVNNSCGRIIRTEKRDWPQMALAFADALQELWENPGLRRRLSVAARGRAWDFEATKCIASLYPREAGQHQNQSVEFSLS